MGFDDGRMVLDSPNGTYYSGQTIRGNLIFQQDTVKTFRGIYVKFRGFCKVHWTTRETRRGSTRTKHHNSYEEYVNHKMYLVGGELGEHQIQPGNYDYPFTFQIPDNCPSSFEGPYGHVRYKIKAVVDKALKFNQEKKVAVRVMAPLDLNMDPYCRQPIEMKLDATYYCCCFRSGSTNTVINAPMSGYCPGQKIPIEIACTNTGNIEVEHIKLRISKKVLYIATHQPARRSEKDIIAEIKKGSIPGNTTRNWTVEMEVPTSDIYNLSGCSYIKLDYKFKVLTSPRGCHLGSGDSRKLVIGTTPLVGFQDTVPNLLQDQMPQQIAVVTQQPVPYPGASSYPDNTPYPRNIPYGPDNTPCPPFNPSYPTNDASKSPYPPTQLPYPSGTSNTVTNQPYPITNGLYPDNPPPYPGNNSSNPTVQQNTSSTLPVSPNPVNPMDADTEFDSPDTEKKKEKE